MADKPGIDVSFSMKALTVDLAAGGKTDFIYIPVTRASLKNLRELLEKLLKENEPREYTQAYRLFDEFRGRLEQVNGAVNSGKSFTINEKESL